MLEYEHYAGLIRPEDTLPDIVERLEEFGQDEWVEDGGHYIALEGRQVLLLVLALLKTMARSQVLEDRGKFEYDAATLGELIFSQVEARTAEAWYGNH